MSIFKDPVNWLYPPLTPYKEGRLKVSGGHELYYEECGNPQGKPAVFLHGGPGSGTSEKQRRFWDPRLYRIILFDQRGAGKSTPFASVENNTTWDLVEDMEVLRKHLGIEKWQVFGGSWGCTLGLAYAETHPHRVTELIVRGVYLLRKLELDWLYQFGAHMVFPDAWEEYFNYIPEDERGDLLEAYYKRIISSDEKVGLQAAKIWSQWEGRTSKLIPDADFIASYGADRFALSFGRIEVHYFHHGGFLKKDDQLIADAVKIRKIPGTIVQGRYDMVAPFESAWALHKAWPEAEFVVVPDAGHSAFEPAISRALVAATDKYAKESR